MLDVRPIVRDEVLYVTAHPDRTRKPATIERLAATPLIFYDAESADDDPIRRQLAERAQALGVQLQPKIEVELSAPRSTTRSRSSPVRARGSRPAYGNCCGTSRRTCPPSRRSSIGRVE
jgi:hypothetical protein